MPTVQVRQEVLASIGGKPRLVPPKLSLELVFGHRPGVEFAETAHHSFTLVAIKKPRVRLESTAATAVLDQEIRLRGDGAAFHLK